MKTNIPPTTEIVLDYFKSVPFLVYISANFAINFAYPLAEIEYDID